MFKSGAKSLAILFEPLFKSKKKVASALIQRCLLWAKERKAGAASIVPPVH